MCLAANIAESREELQFLIIDDTPQPPGEREGLSRDSVEQLQWKKSLIFLTMSYFISKSEVTLCSY